jgi:pyrroline-5-carboxylate reductase
MTPFRPLVLIGAGNMGGAVLRGWLANDIDPNSILVVDPGLSDEMAVELNASGVRSCPVLPDGMIASVLMLAIKPQMMEKVLPFLAIGTDHETVIVSIAAGTTIKSIKSYLPNGIVVRTMPNTPAMIGRGITGVVAEDTLSVDDRALISLLLEVCGPVEWLEDEKLIDAVTAVSGSGPAYIFLLAEVMAIAGEKAGLDPDLAMRLARETVAGAGELLYRSDLPASTLRQNVTSPNGTTAAALSVLMEDDAMQAIFTKAIMAAKKRSEELAG